MKTTGAAMGTIAVPWPDEVPLSEPGFVKVVTDRDGNALYFSRSPIPFYRDGVPAGNAGLQTGTAKGANQEIGVPAYLKHVGLYAFRAPFLQTYASLPQTPLEKAEALEQLRALEHGHRIAVFISRYRGYEVNTPADYEAFVARQKGKRA
jgi:3-deoxy-manno-octulosonate cytidylyltransferase (CMP-KDO synthetase)